MIALMHGASLAETTAFVTVVELKSFTKAAKQLALSPPRVSEMIRNLEERLGVRLVERTTRSVAPTAAGERLLERLRPVLDEYQSALESTDEFRGKPAGMLRVTAPPPAGDFFLASAIPRFLAHYPEISLDLSFTDALTDIVAATYKHPFSVRHVSSAPRKSKGGTSSGGTVTCTRVYANFLLFSATQAAREPALDSASIFWPFGSPFACSVKIFTKSYIDGLSRQYERKTLRVSAFPKQKGRAAIASELRWVSRSRFESEL